MAAAIAYNNLATASTAEAYTGIYGSSSFDSIAFDASYPASNMADADPSKVARFNYDQAGLSSVAIAAVDFDSTDAAPFRVVAALNVRIPSTITAIQIRVSTYAGSALWSGATFTLSDLVPIAGTTDRYNIYEVLSSTTTGGGRIDLYFTVPANDIDYIEIGALWVSDAVVIDEGFDGDWSFTPSSRSNTSESDAGKIAGFRNDSLDKWSINRTGLGFDVAVRNSADFDAPTILSAYRFADRDTPIVMVGRDDSTFDLQTRSIYGYFDSDPRFKRAPGDKINVDMTFREYR